MEIQPGEVWAHAAYFTWRPVGKWRRSRDQLTPRCDSQSTAWSGCWGESASGWSFPCWASSQKGKRNWISWIRSTWGSHWCKGRIWTRKECELFTLTPAGCMWPRFLPFTNSLNQGSRQENEAHPGGSARLSTLDFLKTFWIIFLHFLVFMVNYGIPPAIYSVCTSV